MTYLGPYCRGIEVRHMDGTTAVEVRHGDIHCARHRCECTCHAEQVVGEIRFDVEVLALINLVAAIAQWHEEAYGADLDVLTDAQDDDAAAQDVLERVIEWMCETEDSPVQADVDLPGCFTYSAEITEITERIGIPDTKRAITMAIVVRKQNGNEVPGQLSIT